MTFILGLIIGFVFSQTPLDDFINAPDSHYKWIDTGVMESGVNLAGKWDAYLINMTSQKWLNETYVNKPIWWHWLWIIIPETVKYNDFASVVGDGYHNSQNWPDKSEETFRACQYLATHTNTIVSVLYNIPNEPLVFYNDPLQKSRSEDSIIAFGWDQYRQIYDKNANDPFRFQWLTHFPMAKATVRAMDTLTAFVKQKNGYDIQRFTAAGASKRGWSTWLTAAYSAANDNRIVAFVPMVMDMPNMHTELHHMYKAYGGWTFAFEDYYNENLTRYLDTDYFLDMMNATDPYAYFDRYKGTYKMLIDAVNDEFFMPDDEYYWWNNFPDPKYFQINPDAEHSLATAIEELVPTLGTFLKLYLDKYDMPTITWNIEENTGIITANYNGNTSMIVDSKIWAGRSCGKDRRDFRVVGLNDPNSIPQCRCGIPSNGYCLNLQSLFNSSDVKPISMNGNNAQWSVQPPNIPTDYWEGFMISIRVKFFDSEHPWMFDSEYINITDNDDRPFLVEYGEMQFTTEVSIVPQTFPFNDCNGQNCYGVLV